MEEDRRVRKTRQALRGALVELMAEKDVRDITVKELTGRADVNRGTFYCHYRDVYDMLTKVEEEMFGEFTAVMDAYPSDELRQGLRPILRDVFRFVGKNADLCGWFLRTSEDSGFFQRLRGVIRDKTAQEWEGLYPFRDERQREQCLAFLVGGCVGLARQWLDSGMAETAEEMAGLAEGLIVGGITIRNEELGMKN